MGLGLQQADASWAAHEKYYEMAISKGGDDGFDILVLENVPEYSEEIVRNKVNKLAPGKYDIISEVIDPRHFGQPTARPRRYFLITKRKTVSWAPDADIKAFMKSLQTCPRMDALAYWWMQKPPGLLSLSQEQRPSHSD